MVSGHAETVVLLSKGAKSDIKQNNDSTTEFQHISDNNDRTAVKKQSDFLRKEKAYEGF